MPQFATRFVLICNKTKLPQFVTSLPHFVIHIYVCYWVLLLLLQPLWFSVRESNLPSHMTHWSCDHMILKKNFISTFASTIPTNFSKEWLSRVNDNHRVTWLIYHVITLYWQKCLSPVSQRQWSLNLVGLWARAKRPNLLYQVTCRSSDHVLFEKLLVSPNARPQTSVGYIKQKNTKMKRFFCYLKDI